MISKLCIRDIYYNIVAQVENATGNWRKEQFTLIFEVSFELDLEAKNKNIIQTEKKGQFLSRGAPKARVKQLGHERNRDMKETEIVQV